MKKLKLMPDYGCFPLWDNSPDSVGNVDPESLPISVTLKSALTRWADDYDSTLNSENPLLSNFASDESQRAFEAKGRELLQRLKQELAANYEITLQL